jgi:hypothetical protein
VTNLINGNWMEVPDYSIYESWGNDRVQETAKFLFPAAYRGSQGISTTSQTRSMMMPPEVIQRKQDSYMTTDGYYILHTYSTVDGQKQNDSVYKLMNESGDLLHTQVGEGNLLDANIRWPSTFNLSDQEVEEFMYSLQAFKDYGSTIITDEMVREPTQKALEAVKKETPKPKQPDKTYKDYYWDYVNANDSYVAAENFTKMLSKVDRSMEPASSGGSWVEEPDAPKTELAKKTRVQLSPQVRTKLFILWLFCYFLIELVVHWGH